MCDEYKKDYLNSNLVIEKISNEYSVYKKWTGKSLLLMSKNFYQLGDAFQASYILESVIENFEQMPTIVDEAKKNLLRIKQIESEKSDPSCTSKLDLGMTWYDCTKFGALWRASVCKYDSASLRALHCRFSADVRVIERMTDSRSSCAR